MKISSRPLGEGLGVRGWSFSREPNMKLARLSRIALLVALFVALSFLISLDSPPVQAQQAVNPNSQNSLPALRGRILPIYFVENVGQFDSHVKFQAQGEGMILTVQDKGLTLSVLEPLPKQERNTIESF